MQLRPYQQAAVDAVYNHLRDRDDNPCVVIPTAGGKTNCMATICRDAVLQWGGRVLILAHVKELLQQSADKLTAVCPEVDFGIYSAGLKRRDTNNAVIIAGIQSVYRRACELDAFDLVMVDECFVEGTLISTPSGAIPIEEVQPGMFVCHASGVGKVLATSARKVDQLVKLEYSDGTEITCTPNHPIFTESGWKSAATLEVGSLAIGIEGMRMLWEKVLSVGEVNGRWKPTNPEGKTLDETEILLDLLLQDPQQLCHADENYLGHEWIAMAPFVPGGKSNGENLNSFLIAPSYRRHLSRTSCSTIESSLLGPGPWSLTALADCR